MPRHVLIAAALCLGGCGTTTSAQHVRQGRLCKAVDVAEGEPSPLGRSLAMALVAKSGIQLHLHLLSRAEVKTELGLLPAAFLHDHRLLRYKIEVRRPADAEVLLHIEALSSARERYTTVVQPNKEDLMALLITRPEVEAAPGASNLRQHFVIDGFLRVMTFNRVKLKKIDERIDRHRRFAWRHRRERHDHAWRDKVLSDPIRRAALAKLEQYTEPHQFASLEPDKPLEGLLLLERSDYNFSSQRGVTLELRTTLRCGGDSAIHQQGLTIPLTDPEDLEAGLNARFARGYRPLTELVR